MYNQGIRETQNVRIASESVIEEYWRKYEDTLYKFNTDTRRLKSELMKRRRLGESNAQMYHAQQQRVERYTINHGCKNGCQVNQDKNNIRSSERIIFLIAL